MTRLRTAAGVALVLALVAPAAFRAWRTRGISAVQRGYDVAAAHGCFGCHGPGGLRGFSDDSGSLLGDVPPFARDELESYAKNESEIREWIMDGMPRRLREETARGESFGPARVLVMPSFGTILSASEIDDLVAYVTAVADYHAPDDGPLAAGREVAARFGCFTCHGPQGRGSLPNPRSFKGYVPSWDGPDFSDLAYDAREVREWILDGGPARLRSQPLARFFLARQALQMPSYRGRITDADVDVLVGYIEALRGGETAAAKPQASPSAN